MDIEKFVCPGLDSDSCQIFPGRLSKSTGSQSAVAEIVYLFHGFFDRDVVKYGMKI